ncbi:MAG: formate dehydrogenase subunit alpha [Planctomycetia bacterium]|nr:formate dehydrogenase subunit alpha [Planctomycetia bacterium]
MDITKRTSITITLNGASVEIHPDETILQVAYRNGIIIPILCYDPRLSCTGHCKVCLVEVDGKLKTSCVEKAREGMVVITHSTKAIEARKKRVQAVLKRHKGNCNTCHQFEFCGLLDLSESVGLGRPHFTNQEKQVTEVFQNKIQIDMDKCISCGKCVRVCHDVRKVGALRHPSLSPDVDTLIYSKNCEECGQCAVICPTGAIVEKYRHRSQRRLQTTCNFCATGCSFYLDVQDDKVVGVTTDDVDPVGRGNLCVKGRFGFEFIHHPDRLKVPLVRNSTGFTEVTWDEALSLIAKRFMEIKEKFGPQTIGGIGSARATNEENYMFQKLMRTALQTNNVDNCARLCHSPAAAALGMALGMGASTTSLADMEYTDVIVVIGSNTTEAHPISALHIKWAHARGAKLIVVDPRRIPLVNEADLHLQLRPGTNIALFNGLLRVLIEEGLIYEEFIEKNTTGWKKTAEKAMDLSLEEVEAITGVPVAFIRKAAMIYGSSRRSMLVSGLGVDEHQYGTQGMLALINLALATGNIGKPGTGILCLRGQNNVQGACDMGCLPAVLPGYQSISDEGIRKKFSNKWGTPVPDWVGKNSAQMWDTLKDGGEGSIRAMYIWGEDPVQTHGDANRIIKGMEKLDFVVYQDIFHTMTSKYAHVVLPAASFAEKTGTYTSTERRVRLIRQAISQVGFSRPDWSIFQDLSNRMGVPSEFHHSEEIYDEMASLSPWFQGISHKRLGTNGIQWPCHDENDPGTQRLYAKGFPKGQAKFFAISYHQPSEEVNDEFPLILTTGRRLYHFNNSAQTMRTETAAGKHETLDMNPEDLKLLNLQDGQMLNVRSRRGAMAIPLRSDPGIVKGTVFTSFHLPQFPVNKLIGGERDTHTDTYSFKFCAVAVEAIS